MYFIGWVENMHIKPFGELPFSFEALVGGQNKSNYRLRILYVLVFSVEFFLVYANQDLFTLAIFCKPLGNIAKDGLSSTDIVFRNLKWTFKCNIVLIQSVDSISNKYQMYNIRILFSISVQYGFAFIHSNRSFYSQPLHTYGNMWGLERSCLTRCSKQHTLSCVFIYLSHVWKPLGTL